MSASKDNCSSEGIGHQTTVYRATQNNDYFLKITKNLAEVGKNFYSRGWVLGTSGNFSSVISREPLRLAITSRGSDKGKLTLAQFLEIDGAGNVVGGSAGQHPSAETLLHLTIVRLRNAGTVLHTHSVWSTVLSDLHV